MPRTKSAALLLLLPAAAAEEAVRGVAAADWAAYRSGGALFHCRDGQAEIPLAKLNDEYCDCADGSDEPGTSACALGRFHCANVGFRPMALPSSRVDDGICDCCDGTDEAGAAGNVGCVSDCDAVGVEHRKAAAERAATYERGLATARGYAAKGSAARQGWDAEIEAKRAELSAAKATAEGVRVEKEAAEAVEREMQEAERKKREAEAAAATAVEAEVAARRVAELEALGALRTRCEAERSVDEAAVAECAEASAAEAQSAGTEALADRSGEACIGWAEHGECENNAHFMASNCASTCALQASAEAGAAEEEEGVAAASAAAVEGAPVDARLVCAGRVGGEGGTEFASRCHALAAGFRGECEALVATGPCDSPRLASLAEDCDCAAGLSKGGGGLVCHCAPCASVAPCLAPQCDVCGPANVGCDATRGQWGCYGVAGEAPARSAVEVAEAAAARTAGAGLESLKATAAEPSAEAEEEETPDPDESHDPDPYGEHYTAGEDGENAYDEDLYREGEDEWAAGHDEDAELQDDTVGEEYRGGYDEETSSRYRGGDDDDEDESASEEESVGGVRSGSPSATKAASSSTSDLPKDAGTCPSCPASHKHTALHMAEGLAGGVGSGGWGCWSGPVCLCATSSGDAAWVSSHPRRPFGRWRVARLAGRARAAPLWGPCVHVGGRHRARRGAGGHHAARWREWPTFLITPNTPSHSSPPQTRRPTDHRRPPCPCQKPSVSAPSSSGPTRRCARRSARSTRRRRSPRSTSAPTCAGSRSRASASSGRLAASSRTSSAPSARRRRAEAPR